MTDTTQGQDAPNDSELFNEAVEATTLNEFENPKPAAPAPEKPATEKPVGEKPAAEKSEDTAPVPAGRLREEAERARKAERERDDLRTQLLAVQATRQPPQQPAQQRQPPELLDDPSGFVRAELQPFLQRMEAEQQAHREAMSLDYARQRHGHETVDAAYRAMEAGMQRGDPDVYAAYQRIMKSHDPYGSIVRWHREGEVVRETGGDLSAYRKRILEEALADPEYRARAIEAAKGQAAATGQHVARPVKTAVATSPSLGNIGAGGGDQQVIEPSDIDLFRGAVNAKRR